MKNFTKKTIVRSISVLLFFSLVSCGGGNASKNDQYNTVVWRHPSAQKCQQVMADNLSVNDVNLATQQEIDIQQMLEMVSPKQGYQLFLRDKKDFMYWIKDRQTTLTTAVHETTHYIDAIAPWCVADQYSRYFLNGQFHVTSLYNSETENYSIVEQTIPERLKKRGRYQVYIENSKDADGNLFNLLLDELNAYVAGSQFQINFIHSGLPLITNNYTAFQNFQVDGVVDMMLYLEYYLKSARLNFPDTYKAINEPATLNVILNIWVQAEKTLHNAYPLLVEQKANSGYSNFFDAYGEKLSALEILKAVYSSDALTELDQLGIKHETLNDWQATYLTYDLQ